MLVSEKISHENQEIPIKKIESKEDAFAQLSQALSYFHVLTIFNNSKHIVLTKNERNSLFIAANNRLRHLQVNGNLTSREKDPYLKNFLE